MSSNPGPEIDPDSSQPMGDVKRFTRRRVGPAKLALAVLLAVLITAVGAVIVAVVLWALQGLFH